MNTVHVCLIIGNCSVPLHFSSISLQCNLNRAKLCTNLKWENIRHCPSSVWNDTLKQKKNDLWGWGKQQHIRGLLHYYLPWGLLPRAEGYGQKGQDLDIFPVTYSHHLSEGASLHDILYLSAQGKDMFLAHAQMQHPEVWPCSTAQPSSNLPPETPDEWNWYLAWNLWLSIVSQLGISRNMILGDKCCIIRSKQNWNVPHKKCKWSQKVNIVNWNSLGNSQRFPLINVKIIHTQTHTKEARQAIRLELRVCGRSRHGSHFALNKDVKSVGVYVSRVKW